MGLVLDSGVLIAGEREAKPLSNLLLMLEHEHGETEIVLSAITVIELEHRLNRAQTAEQAQNRREYLTPFFRPSRYNHSPRKWPTLRRRSTLIHGSSAAQFRLQIC